MKNKNVCGIYLAPGIGTDGQDKIENCGGNGSAEFGAGEAK
jgi:hypothetical protein